MCWGMESGAVGQGIELHAEYAKDGDWEVIGDT